MKKIILMLGACLLFLTGCMQNTLEEEVVQEETEQQQTTIVPSYKLDESNYRMILPYKVSEARGAITNQIANRVDITEMEEGLMRHSKSVYDPDSLYFQEGQYLTTDMIYSWIDELNPAVESGSAEESYRENPRYLSHILEQNYLRHNEDQSVELAGISIGIAMKSVYSFQTEPGGPSYYEDIPYDDMMAKGKEMAQKILEEIRKIEGLENTPVMMSIYQEEEQSSPVPGNFVAKANIPADSSTIGEWESLNEENILFPSDNGREKYFEDHELISNFGTKVDEFFPNYVGYIGQGFYIDEELQELKVTIPIEFNGKAEVIGFTQYVYGLVQDMFQNYYDLEIVIESSEQMESLIYRKAGEETPEIHVYQ